MLLWVRLFDFSCVDFYFIVPDARRYDGLTCRSQLQDSPCKTSSGFASPQRSRLCRRPADGAASGGSSTLQARPPSSESMFGPTVHDFDRARLCLIRAWRRESRCGMLDAAPVLLDGAGTAEHGHSTLQLALPLEGERSSSGTQRGSRCSTPAAYCVVLMLMSRRRETHAAGGTENRCHGVSVFMSWCSGDRRRLPRSTLLASWRVTL